MLRTRFAPSPTGFLHIGGLRTALYAYLTAKKNHGVFILRIEDTDQKRYVEGATENLIKTLRAFGLDYDEGPEKGGPHQPYLQSQRTEIYRKHAQQLLDSQKAYHCFCTTERLEKVREEQQKKKLPPMYDRKCRELPASELEQLIKNGTPFVIRQKIPFNTNVTFTDLIRGEMHFRPELLDDHVLMKSDSFPTYHLANVVDDHEMQITHVIRGEEWLPSAPKHVLLYQDFGWPHPEFAHIPLLLNPDKSKLSKRQGHVAAEEFLKEGYLPAAILNFIALLGWNPGTEQEIFSLDELIQAFSLERVQKAGAIFSHEKLDWFNQHYIRQLTADQFLEKIRPYLEKDQKLDQNIIKNEKNYLIEAAKLEQERIVKLSQAPTLLKFFLVEQPEYETELFIHQKMGVDLETAKKALTAAKEVLEKLPDYHDEQKNQEILIALVQKMALKNGQLLWPIRVALSGEKFSPGVFELMRVLGKEKVLNRISFAIEKLAK